VLATLALLFACVAGAAPVALGPSRPFGTIAAEVRGLRSAQGSLRAKLVAAPEGFPGSDAHVVAKRRVAIEGDSVRLTFAGIPYGSYALVVLHDEDDDGTLARSPLGLPAEGLGFSAGARIRFGPPSFDAARFAVDAARVELGVEVGY